MRLFIAGPMRGIEDHNFPAFRAAAQLLRLIGYEVEDPSEKGLIDSYEWADYMRESIAQLLTCDGVALLRGWAQSPGAMLEVVVAEALGMTCQGVEFWGPVDAATA